MTFIDTFAQQAPPFVTVIGSSLVASVYYWATQRAGVDNPEPFKPAKAGVTMGVAFALSVVLFVTGRATGYETLLPNLSVGVGPIALWIQQGVKQYRRTGHITIVNGEVDDAAEAFAAALGLSASDLFALAGAADATGGTDSATQQRFDRLAEDAPRGSDPAIDEPRPMPDPEPDSPPENETGRHDETGSTPTDPTPADEARSVVETAHYRDLQRVAGYFADVDGSGRQGRSKFYHDLRRLAEDRPQEVLNAYDTVRSK